jgi:glutamate synthase (NADPH/NADH) large chain/glutamate synthase (ferredoxin)
MDKAIWNKGQTDEAQLKKLLEDHNRWTGSKRARELLDDWNTARAKFVKVFPIEYKRALGEMAAKKIKSDAQKETPAGVNTAPHATKKAAKTV